MWRQREISPSPTFNQFPTVVIADGKVEVKLTQVKDLGERTLKYILINREVYIININFEQYHIFNNYEIGIGQRGNGQIIINN